MSAENQTRLRVISQFSGSSPRGTQAERLKIIGDIATGKVDPLSVRRTSSPTMAARVAAGRASRAKRMTSVERAQAEEDAEKGKRKAPKGRDRKRTGDDRNREG